MYIKGTPNAEGYSITPVKTLSLYNLLYELKKAEMNLISLDKGHWFPELWEAYETLMEELTNDGE